MSLPTVPSQQPTCLPWMKEQLLHEQAVALSSDIDISSTSTYSSTLQSYLTFCHTHTFPTDPTPNTLSFYVVYMSHHIKPTSVDSYLSGICNQLEPFYPDVRHNHRSSLVTRTLRGCKKLHAIPTTRKQPLSCAEIGSLHPIYSEGSHDNILFLAILTVGFHGLLGLGKLVWPDHVSLQDYRKVVKRPTVTLLPNGFSFLLPSHKADRYFEGNRVVVLRSDADDDSDQIGRAHV